MGLRRHLLVPSTLVAVFVIALVSAGGASADILTGEATFAELPSIEPEADIVAGRAEYDPTFGRVLFDVTTVAAPLAEPGGEPSGNLLGAFLGDMTGGCNLASLENGDFAPPLLVLTAFYRDPFGTAYLENSPEDPAGPDGFPSKSVSGETTTLAYTSSKAVGQGYNCAAIAVASPGTTLKWDLFPIAVPPPPPPAEPALSGSQGSTAPAASSPPPAAGPPSPSTPPGAPILSIAKPKRLTLKAGRWRTVKLTITNTGNAGIGRGSVRVTPPKGVSVKPEKQQLPALAPGKSWTVSVRVERTKGAKQKSTLPVIASAPGATSVTDSLVLKLKE
jgi:NPCBM-associated, NEW3 domain of alpha-galactosidase